MGALGDLIEAIVSIRTAMLALSLEHTQVSCVNRTAMLDTV